MNPDIFSSIFTSLVSLICIPFIISVNILTFFIIKSIDRYSNKHFTKKTLRRTVAVVVNISMVIFFKHLKIANNDVLITSFFITPLAYNYIMRYLLKAFNIQYKEEDLQNF